jgi:hypothetical protein
MTIDKNALKKVMISNYENIIAELREELATKKGSSDLDENDTLDPEDYSTQTVSNVMVDLLKEQIAKTEKDLERIHQIDFSPKEEASVGALVTTDMFNFFLGVATVPFLYEHKQIVGVSVSAPIFVNIKGKKVGDTFTFSGHQYNIHAIQ